MAVDIFKSVINPISGETFKGISFTPESFVMQWSLQPQGYVPFEHIHLNQEEIFTVEKGEIKIMLDGKERIAKAGESISVAKGVRHLASNNKSEMLECKVIYKPALDYNKFMQCLMGLTLDNHLDKKGGINIPKMGYFLVRMKAKSMARPTEIPAPLFNIALKVFYLRGRLSGWGKLYSKYTGEE